MPRYRVTIKKLHRASAPVWVEVAAGPGQVPTLAQQIPTVRHIPQGTILEDVTEAELAAMPEVFELVEE